MNRLGGTVRPVATSKVIRSPTAVAGIDTPDNPAASRLARTQSV